MTIKSTNKGEQEKSCYVLPELSHHEPEVDCVEDTYYLFKNKP
jgi:hypothetical protein